MTPQIESLIQKIVSFKQALVEKAQELNDDSTEILDNDTFCAVLSGIPSFRRLPGVPEHMGFENIYHCDSEEHQNELKSYFENVFGITDEASLVEQKGEFFHIFNEYYDFACEWDGNPNFDVADLPEDGAQAYEKSREFAKNFRDIVGQQGFLAWDIGERIMLIRAACACGIISDEAYTRLALEEAKTANELFDNFIDYAISALVGAVYFMFVSMGRSDLDGLEAFLDINMKIVSKLFQDDIWSFNAWIEKDYKQLAIHSDQIQDLLGEEFHDLTGIATDRILCEGYRISVMFREPAVAESDSGWRFFAGDEDQDYIQNGNNFGALDLNLICNYSPDAIEFLSMPVGTLVARNDEGVFEVMKNGDAAEGDD